MPRHLAALSCQCQSAQLTRSSAVVYMFPAYITVLLTRSESGYTIRVSIATVASARGRTTGRSHPYDGCVSFCVMRELRSAKLLAQLRPFSYTVPRPPRPPPTRASHTFLSLLDHSITSECACACLRRSERRRAQELPRRSALLAASQPASAYEGEGGIESGISQRIEKQAQNLRVGHRRYELQSVLGIRRQSIQ